MGFAPSRLALFAAGISLLVVALFILMGEPDAGGTVRAQGVEPGLPAVTQRSSELSLPPETTLAEATPGTPAPELPSARQVVAQATKVVQAPAVPNSEYLNLDVRVRRLDAKGLKVPAPGVSLSLGFGDSMWAPTDEAAVTWSAAGERAIAMVTDWSGMASVRIPWPRSIDLGTPLEQVPVIKFLSPAHLETIAASYSRRHVGRPKSMRLDIFVKSQLLCRVFGSDGQQIAAKVELLQRSADGSWRRFADEACGADGATTLSAVRGGEFFLRAHVPPGASTTARLKDAVPGELVGVGSGVSDSFLVDALGPQQEIHVTVGGQGIVRGRVVDENGIPMPQVSLRILHRRVDSRGSMKTGDGLMELADVDLVHFGGGAWGGHVTTDRNGEFALFGLRDGDYVVRTKGFGWTTAYSAALTPIPVPCDGVPLQLELGQPRILVKLVDSSGSPAIAKQPRQHLDSKPREPFDWDEGLPPSGTVSAEVLNPSELVGLIAFWLTAKPLGLGEYLFEPRPGALVKISIDVLEPPLIERTIRVPKDAGMIEVLIEVDPDLLVPDF